MKALDKILALVGAAAPTEDIVPVTRDSKHAGGHRRSRGWHTALRRRRKADKLARRAHRRG